MQYPKFDEQFILTVDAAKYGVGAVLSQITNDAALPIAFGGGELNKSTIENELTAIHFAIKHFKPYLLGT